MTERLRIAYLRKWGAVFPVLSLVMPAGLQPDRELHWCPGDPGTLQSLATDLATEYAARRTVLVVFFDPQFERMLARGTGVCISIGGRFFVATAAHEFLRVPKPFRVGVVAMTTAPTSTIFLPTNHNHRGGGDSESVDVAWLEFSAENARGIGREFLTLDAIEPFCKPSPAELLFAYGFPEMMEVTPLPHGQWSFELAALSHMTYALDPRYISEEFRPNPAFDIFARYSRTAVDGDVRQDRLSQLPEAPGMSGGGFWRLNMRGPVWTPTAARLVGIQHEWWPDGEWFRATKIGHWLNLVATDHPALRSAIEARLRRSAARP